jgi:D-beta-D-heptose 7-phosphate kinase/D-beta-D-heptose 1-phosphate adenosyltransferase
MGKIISVNEVMSISTRLHKQKKKIVLVGGCFDVLHVGHIKFLERAKRVGDILFVEVESDQNITRLKGPNRPINRQADRVYVLSRLEIVDYVIPLPTKISDLGYLSITKKVGPAILATTKGDPKNIYLYQQAKTLGITVKEVIDFIPGKSTSKLARSLGIE